MQYDLRKPYRPIPQLPFCCVPATLQWILYRHDLDILDQESIGADLGLRLPTKARALFQNKRITFTDTIPNEGYGTQITKAKYSINGFFKQHTIPLMISPLVAPTSKLSLIDFLQQELLHDNDVILRYNNSITRQKSQPGYGHFSVITLLDLKSDRVMIGDPDQPFFKKVSLDQILYAISNKEDGISRGLYSVRPIERLLTRS